MTRRAGTVSRMKSVASPQLRMLRAVTQQARAQQCDAAEAAASEEISFSRLVIAVSTTVVRPPERLLLAADVRRVYPFLFRLPPTDCFARPLPNAFIQRFERRENE